MEAELFIETENFNFSFEVNEDYYQGNEYIDKLMEEYNSTKDVVFNAVNYGELSSFNSSNKTIDKTNHTDDKDASKGLKTSYTSCMCNLVNESPDTLVQYMLDEQPFTLKFELNILNLDEEFEAELNDWVYSSSRCIDKPCKDLKISFNNNSGGKSYAQLSNCKIACFNKGCLVLKISQISFVKEI